MGSTFRMSVKRFDELAHWLAIQLFLPPFVRLDRIWNAHPSLVLGCQQGLYIGAFDICLCCAVSRKHAIAQIRVRG
eukprot:8314514-Karenia_brevis.AAC.1